MSEMNLYDAEAIKKIEEMAKGIDFAMMATNLGKKPFDVVVMSTKKVDSEGNIWFLTGKDSRHVSNLNEDDATQLIYSDPSSIRFLNVYGKAEFSTDRALLEELYGKADDTWFEGVNDPNLMALKVIPKDVYYWDPKSNKLVALLKMAVGAITGDEPDMMNTGELKV